MERTDICKGLELFAEKLTSQTYLNTYREQSRESLLDRNGLVTRANSIWKMAQYVVAYNPNINKTGSESPNVTTNSEVTTKNDSDEGNSTFAPNDISENDTSSEIIDQTVDSSEQDSKEDKNNVESEKSAAEHTHPLSDYIRGWEKLSRKYQNQYLIIQDNDGKWYMYDSTPQRIGDESYIETLINKHKTIVNSINKISQSDSEFKAIIHSLHTKPFLILSGISGTGKSRKVKELAFATCPIDPELGLNQDPTNPGNYCLIPVRPNWHDSTELLGYYSSIRGKYMFTDFVRFVYKASKEEYKNVPFFVCLDEMNLAPIEQYFAEYLSVLETRTKLKDGRIVSAELITKKSFKDLKDEIIVYESQQNVGSDDGVRIPVKKQIYEGEDLKVFQYIQEHGLRLPQNLFVIGTVNMDDTTHQFSRKVIDRAFTIEMNGGDFKSIFNKRDTLTYVEDPLSSDVVIPQFAKSQDVIDAFPDDADTIEEKVPELLKAINEKDIFGDTPFRVSFRVENELILYFGSLRMMDKEASTEDLINQAFLAVLLEKVLPRVEGDERVMQGGNTDGKTILSHLRSELEKKFKDTDKSSAIGELYNTIIKKLNEMDSRLQATYFTSFFS